MIKYLLKFDIYNLKLIRPIKIGDITIIPVKNIDSIYAEIKRTGNPHKTCYASSYLYYEKKCTCSEIQSSPKYNDTVKRLEIICCLISFSQKCHIPYYGIYLYKKRKRISANYSATYFGKPVGASKFICDEDTLVHFINSSLNTILSKNDKEKNVILTSLWLYIQSFNGKHQIGAELVELWIIFEMLVNFYSTEMEFDTIINKKSFKPIRDRIDKVLDEVLDDYIKDEKNTKNVEEYKNGLQQIKKGIGNLNQQKFINKAVSVLSHSRIYATDVDIKSINYMRNLVFHGNILNGSKQTQTCVAERQLNFLLEHLYLKIFKYNNKYSDSDWKYFHAHLFVFDRM